MNNYDFLDVMDTSFLPSQDIFINSGNGDANNNINYNNTNNGNLLLYGPYEGYIKGNLFKNLYSQYKNYRPSSISPTNDKEEALLNLNQIQFAMHELNLYLDVYPNDSSAMRQFTTLKNTYNNLLNDFENRFGAININCEYLNSTPFSWSSSSWPWNGGNM